jgi:hypothetical protein
VIADIGTEYPNFAWWTLVYMLGVIGGVIVTVATNSIATYHVAIVGFLAAGLVFTTSSVNSLIYYPEGSKEAGAAGFILLSMVAVSLRKYDDNNDELTISRLCGSSTTDPSHRRPIDRRSTRSRYTRIMLPADARAGT